MTTSFNNMKFERYQIGTAETVQRLNYIDKEVHEAVLDGQATGIRFYRPHQRVIGQLFKTAKVGENRINLSSAAKFMQRVNKGGSRALYFLKLAFMSKTKREALLDRTFRKIKPQNFQVLSRSAHSGGTLSDTLVYSPPGSTLSQNSTQQTALRLVEDYDSNALKVTLKNGQDYSLLNTLTLEERAAPLWEGKLPISDAFKDYAARHQKPGHSFVRFVEKAYLDLGTHDVMHFIFQEMTPDQRGHLLAGCKFPKNNEQPFYYFKASPGYVEVLHDKKTYYVDPKVTVKKLAHLFDTYHEKKLPHEGERHQVKAMLLSQMAQRLTAEALGYFLEEVSEAQNKVLASRSEENEVFHDAVETQTEAKPVATSYAKKLSSAVTHAVSALIPSPVNKVTSAVSGFLHNAIKGLVA